MAYSRILIIGDHYPRMAAYQPFSPVALAVMLVLGLIAFGVVAALVYFYYYYSRNQQQPQGQPQIEEMEMVSIHLTSTIYEQTVNGDITECSICFESFVDGDRITILRCTHIFHEGCITLWRSHATCPLCRGAF